MNCEDFNAGFDKAVTVILNAVEKHYADGLLEGMDYEALRAIDDIRNDVESLAR